jgi:hypothetical protein
MPLEPAQTTSLGQLKSKQELDVAAHWVYSSQTVVDAPSFRERTMKLRTACALLLISSSLPVIALGQERANERRLMVTINHVEESRPAMGRGSIVRAVEINCHPSRGALLMKTIHEAETDPLKQRQARATIAILRKQMSVAEKRETAKLFRIQRNEQKYLAAQARKEQRLAERELERKQSLHLAAMKNPRLQPLTARKLSSGR